MEGCEEEIPPDVRHLFVQTYGSELIIDKICKLDKLRTLIIDGVDVRIQVEEKVVKSLFMRLKKLRVLIIPVYNDQGTFSVPECIGQLRHLRYLRHLPFETRHGKMLVLPSTLSKLYHMQVLDFSNLENLVLSSRDGMFGLINLRHMAGMPFLKIPRVSRMTLLRTLQKFEVGKEQGCELKQLGGLNQLLGKLSIAGLGNVETRQEALEAKLGDKEGLTALELWWGRDTRGELKKQEAQTEVLEGLCPPKHLESLRIYSYHGLRYPSWMMGQRDGGPKYLNELSLHHCSTELGQELGGFWPHLRWFYMHRCSSSTMPDHMEHLTSLRRLDLDWCPNIRSLPTLPRSLEKLSLTFCHETLMSACRRAGDPTWEKFQHVPYVCVSDLEEDIVETRARVDGGGSSSSSAPKAPSSVEAVCDP